MNIITNHIQRQDFEKSDFYTGKGRHTTIINNSTHSSYLLLRNCLILNNELMGKLDVIIQSLIDRIEEMLKIEY